MSGNSGTVDFEAARADGKEFAYLRAGRGITPASGVDSAGLDTKWNEYRAGAAAAGLKIGGYWRFFPQVSMDDQITKFSDRVSTQLELPPMVDIEDTGGLLRTALTDWAIRVLSGVETRTGVRPMLYTNKSFLAELDATRLLPRWPLALARWTTDPTWPDDRAVFWQYTGNSRVGWATGPVDFQRTRI